LARAAERRAHCIHEMERCAVDFSFIDALDGEKLSEEEIATAYDADANATLYKRPLSRSEIGCHMSHLALWRRIAEAEAPGAVVLEDDFLLDNRFSAVLDALAPHDLRDCVVKLHAAKPVVGEDICSLASDFRLVAPRTAPGLTLGYAIGREAARRLSTLGARFARPVDMDLKHWWELDTPILLVQPSVLRVAALGEQSFIERDRRNVEPVGLAPSLRRMASNLRYQFRFQLGKRWALQRQEQAIDMLQRRIAERRLKKVA